MFWNKNPSFIVGHDELDTLAKPETLPVALPMAGLFTSM